MSNKAEQKTILFSRGSTEVQSHPNSIGATVSGLIVGREEICISTSSVTRLAGGRRAVAGIVRGNSESSSCESGVAAHVDAREIPVDGGLFQGVLVLQDFRLVWSGGHLNGDTATVRVEAPVFGVARSAGGQSDHLAISGFAD